MEKIQIRELFLLQLVKTQWSRFFWFVLFCCLFVLLDEHSLGVSASFFLFPLRTNFEGAELNKQHKQSRKLGIKASKKATNTKSPPRAWPSSAFPAPELGGFSWASWGWMCSFSQEVTSKNSAAKPRPAAFSPFPFFVIPVFPKFQSTWSWGLGFLVCFYFFSFGICQQELPLCKHVALDLIQDLIPGFNSGFSGFNSGFNSSFRLPEQSPVCASAGTKPD